MHILLILSVLTSGPQYTFVHILVYNSETKSLSTNFVDIYEVYVLCYVQYVYKFTDLKKIDSINNY
jgi:hypothetical protein